MATTMNISQEESKSGFALFTPDQHGECSAGAVADSTTVTHAETSEMSRYPSICLAGRLVAFLFPIVGLIMYLTWKDKKPEKASTAGCLAAWGFALGVIAQLLSSTV